MQRKIFGLILIMALILSTATMAFAGGGNSGEDKGNGNANKPLKVEQEQTNLQKIFKAELNAQKKATSKAKGALEEQKLLLMEQYDALIAAGQTVEAEALLAEIATLDTQIAVLQAQMKEIINQRYMIIKTLYSEEELAQFTSAAEVIAQMYADAAVLGAGSVIVKDNIIKLEAPAYIKGGRTIIPVREITQELGASVLYDPATQSVTVSKDGTDIIFTINSTKVLVDGVEQVLDAAAVITNGRTYVPLRFIAETFGLSVDFDEETGTIDIDEIEEEEIEEELPEEEAPEEEII